MSKSEIPIKEEDKKSNNEIKEDDKKNINEIKKEDKNGVVEESKYCAPSGVSLEKSATTSHLGYLHYLMTKGIWLPNMKRKTSQTSKYSINSDYSLHIRLR